MRGEQFGGTGNIGYPVDSLLRQVHHSGVVGSGGRLTRDEKDACNWILDNQQDTAAGSASSAGKFGYAVVNGNLPQNDGEK